MTFLPEETLQEFHAAQPKPETSPQEDTAKAEEMPQTVEPKHYGWRMAMNACC